MSRATDYLRVGGAPPQTPRSPRRHRRARRPSGGGGRGRRACVFLLRDDEGAAAESRARSSRQPSPTAPALRLSRLGDVKVHRGEKATVRYRVVGPSGARTPVGLLVTDAAGQRVKTRRLTAAAAAGEWLEAAGAERPEARPLHVRAVAGPAIRRRRREPVTGAASASPAPSASASAELVVLPHLPPGFPGTKAVAGRQETRYPAATAMWRSPSSTPTARSAGGYRAHEPFQLASLSKAVMLVAVAARRPHTGRGHRGDADEDDHGVRQRRRVRDLRTGQAKGMRAVAKAAGMQDYEQGSGWVDTRASAWDEARLFPARVAGARRGTSTRAAVALQRHPHPALGASPRPRVRRGGPATSRAAGSVWTTSSWSRPRGWRRAGSGGRSR